MTKKQTEDYYNILDTLYETLVKGGVKMFEKIRAVLDEAEVEFSKAPWEANRIVIDNFEDKLAVALYEEVNIYWLSRKLKLLSDVDTPSDYKLALIEYMKHKPKV